MINNFEVSDYNEENIFDLALSSDRTSIVLTDAYDGNFVTSLTKKQVIELANDLMCIAKTMEGDMQEEIASMKKQWAKE